MILLGIIQYNILCSSFCLSRILDYSSSSAISCGFSPLLILIPSVRNTLSPNPTYENHPHPKSPRSHASFFFMKVSGMHKPEVVLSPNSSIIIDIAFVTAIFCRLNYMILLIFDHFLLKWQFHIVQPDI